MSEIIPEKTASLLDISIDIKKTISDQYKRSYWITGEMVKLNLYPSSGHCYPEIVEKQNGEIVSQIPALLSNTDYLRINNKFQEILDEPLKDGIKIFFCATIIFDPIYGMSLRITDIDPNYSLGEMEKRKQEIIERLKKENLFSKNKELALADLPQRIAIISNSHSKAYADFTQNIDSNKWGYKFFYMLFPTLHKDEATPDIVSQLNRIRKIANHFDAVAILDCNINADKLAYYNEYELGREVSLFPIPVITAIGHSTIETVTNKVSHINVITAKDLADYLIQKIHNFSSPLRKARELMLDKSKHLINNEKTRLSNIVKLDKCKLLINNEKIRITNIVKLDKCKHLVNNEKIKLANLEKLDKCRQRINNEKRKLNNAEQLDKCRQLINNEKLKLNNAEQLDKCKQLVNNEKHKLVNIENYSESITRNKLIKNNILVQENATRLFNELSVLLSKERETCDKYSTELHSKSLNFFRSSNLELKGLVLNFKGIVISNNKAADLFIKEAFPKLKQILKKLFAQKIQIITNSYFKLFK